MKIVCPTCHRSLECESGCCGQKAQCPFCGSKFVITEIMLKPAVSAGRSKWRHVWSGAAAVLCIAAGLGLGHQLFGAGARSEPALATAQKTASAEEEAATAKAETVTANANAETVTAEAEKSAPADDANKDVADATAAATDENKTDESQSGEQNAEDTTTDDDDDGEYTYEYYDGAYVPYYRGYYYIGGAWVWRKHGRPPFPPPRFRPALRSIKSPARHTATKTAPAKAAVVKGSRTPAKAVSSRPAATRHSTTKPAASRPGPYKSAPAKSTTPVRRTTVRSTPHRGCGRVSAPRGPRR